MAYAKVQDDLVVDVLQVEPHTIYPPHVAALYEPCSNDVEIGWIRFGGELVAPIVTIEQYKKELTAEVSRLRWVAETKGITLPGGIVVKTGTEDQNRITSVIANAHLAGISSVDFKAVSGWVTLTVTQVEGIATAIALHVQECFSIERAHHEAIAALEEIVEYDVTANWP